MVEVEEDEDEEEEEQRRGQEYIVLYDDDYEGDVDDDAVHVEEEESEGRLDLSSITSTVNEGFSSVGSSVTSGVDVSGTTYMRAEDGV